MKNEWILDVLADLKCFAQNNSLGALAEQLDDTRLVAAAELSLSVKGTPAHDTCDADAVRQPFALVGKRL